MTSHNDKRAGLSSYMVVWLPDLLLITCAGRAASTNLVFLFSNLSKECGWAQRISGLLEVPVEEDTASSHICGRCKTRVLSLERALADLKSFKETARLALEHCTSHEKRRKQTSGEVGMSPDTFIEQPLSKVARNGLEFSSK